VDDPVALSRKGNRRTDVVLEKLKMNAKELADRFNAKTDAAVVERERQSGLAAQYNQKRSEDIEHCKRAMESNVLPFLEELKQHLGDGQFTFAPQSGGGQAGARSLRSPSSRRAAVAPGEGRPDE
jgi:hypothetical protein